MTRKPEHPFSQNLTESSQRFLVLENAREAWERESRIQNGQKIDFFGVVFDPTALERYEQEIKQAIAEASAVVLQFAPRVTWQQMDALLSEIARQYKNTEETEADVDLIKEKVKQLMLSQNPEYEFFARIESWIGDQGKPLVLMDPENPEKKSAHELGKRNVEILMAKFFATATGAATFYALDKKQRQRASEKFYEKIIDRRQFLKSLIKHCAGALTSAGLLSLIAEVLDNIQKAVETKRGRSDNPFGFALYTPDDFRDVSIAQGLDILTQDNDFAPGPLVAIFEKGNLSAVSHYLGHESERKAKFASYAPTFQNVVTPVIDIFDYNKTDKVWKQKERIPIE